MSNWQRKSTAPGSQQITWKLLGLPPEQRVCALCGRRVRLEDLAQYHVTVGETMRLACLTCGPVLV